jgi:hypothetical protein
MPETRPAPQAGSASLEGKISSPPKIGGTHENANHSGATTFNGGAQSSSSAVNVTQSTANNATGTAKTNSSNQQAPKQDASKVSETVQQPKEKPNFPGIEQTENEIMVSDVRHSVGEGEDHITVTLKRIEGSKEIDGMIWIIGEYVQRGTDGIMYMPSHNELKVAADGKPKFPVNGLKFQMTFGVEKKLTVKRPGFEGEEMVGVKIGFVDKSNGKVHLAHISMRQIQKKAATKRVKVKSP